MPRLTFVARLSGCGFSSTRTPSGIGSATEPGRFETTTVSSTCGTSAGSSRTSSAACPCETTTAETLTGSPSISRYTARVFSAAARQLNACARSRPAAASRSRSAIAVRIPSSSSDVSTNTAASPATSSRAGSRTATTGVPGRHRLEHREPEALVARGLDEAGGSAIEVGKPLRSRHTPRAGRLPDGAPRRRTRPSPAQRRRAGDPPHSLPERGELVFAPLDRADREHVVVRPRPGSKCGVDAVRRHDDALRRDPVELHEVALRALGHGQDSRGVAHRSGDDAAEHEAVLPPHQLGLPLEREIVDGHDARARRAQRAARIACDRATRRAGGARAGATTPCVAPGSASRGRPPRFRRARDPDAGSPRRDEGRPRARARTARAGGSGRRSRPRFAAARARRHPRRRNSCAGARSTTPRPRPRSAST